MLVFESIGTILMWCCFFSSDDLDSAKPFDLLGTQDGSTGRNLWYFGPYYVLLVSVLTIMFPGIDVFFNLLSASSFSVNEG